MNAIAIPTSLSFPKLRLGAMVARLFKQTTKFDLDPVYAPLDEESEIELGLMNHGWNFDEEGRKNLKNRDPRGAKLAVVYNPLNLDSLFAASMLASAVEDVLFVPYQPLGNKPIDVKGRENVLICGVELLQEHFMALHDMVFKNNSTFTGKKAGAGNNYLTVLAYRDSYDWLTQGASKKLNGDVAFMKPSDHWYGELIYRTDNTAIMQMSAFLQQACFADITMPGESRKGLLAQVPDAIYETAILAARLVSHAFPVAPMEVSMENWYESYKKTLKARVPEAELPAEPTQDIVAQWREEELRNRAQIFNMIPLLRKLFTFTDKVLNAKSVHIIRGQLMYSGMENEARTIVSSSLIMDQALSVPTIAAHEINHTMLLSLIVKGHNAAITYEDKPNCRIWRIYADSNTRARSIALRFKSSLSWSEGSVLCIVTALPIALLKH